MKTKGLLIGKFAPLHRGHQSLIEVALSEVDELIIFIYDCPETTNIPLRVRKNWLETLYPKAKVVEIYNGPKILGKTPDIMNLHSNHILENLNEWTLLKEIFKRLSFSVKTISRQDTFVFMFKAAPLGLCSTR